MMKELILAIEKFKVKEVIEAPMNESPPVNAFSKKTLGVGLPMRILLEQDLLLRELQLEDKRSKILETIGSIEINIKQIEDLMYHFLLMLTEQDQPNREHLPLTEGHLKDRLHRIFVEIREGLMNLPAEELTKIEADNNTTQI